VLIQIFARIPGMLGKLL